MSDTETTAPAETPDVAKKPTGPIEIEARIQRMTVGGVTSPALVFKGKTIATGRKVIATLPNGIRYAAKVEECTEVDGEIIATLKDGLTPAKQ